MKRKAALVTAVGVSRDGRPWCVLDETFFRPGDRGHVGPFEVTAVECSVDGTVRHYLEHGAVPYVGELLAAVCDTPDVGPCLCTAITSAMEPLEPQCAGPVTAEERLNQIHRLEVFDEASRG